MFEAWQEYEKIAMHFNDLLIRLRTQALGGVAAVAVLAAIIARGDISATLRWEVLVASFFMLLLFWFAIYSLDTFYYNRLLEGAVDAIVRLETADKKGEPFPGLQLSTQIEDVVATGKSARSTTSCRVQLGRRIFYFTVFAAIGLCLVVSLYGLFNAGVTLVAEGIVTDEQTDKPVNQATVVIALAPSANTPVISTTGEAGTFFMALPRRWQNPLKESVPYQVRVTVSSQDYQTRTRLIRSTQFEGGTNSLRFGMRRSSVTTTNNSSKP
jgi:hypothetical protein